MSPFRSRKLADFGTGIVGALFILIALLTPFLRRWWGSTELETTRALAGDQMVPHPDESTSKPWTFLTRQWLVTQAGMDEGSALKIGIAFLGSPNHRQSKHIQRFTNE